MWKMWEVFAQSSASQRLMLKTLDQLKIHNKIKCELCIYKYKKPNYHWEYFLRNFLNKKIQK